MADRLHDALGRLTKRPSVALRMNGGIYAVEAQKELVFESLVPGDNGSADFQFIGSDMTNVATINMVLSYRSDDFAGSLDLSDKLSQIATVSVRELEPLYAGYTSYSVFITPKSNNALINTLDDEVMLTLTLALNKPGNTTATMILSWLDITYYEGDFADGNPLLANSRITRSIATTLVEVFSRFDVDRDGEVTLRDVEIVRRHLFLAKDSPDWSELAARCDFNGDGVIDYEDLALIMRKYEDVHIYNR